MCCKIPFVSTNFECDNNQTVQTIQPDYLVNNKYYRNGVYFGDIIYSDLNKIQVECKNGNKFMDGQIITINFIENISRRSKGINKIIPIMPPTKGKKYKELFKSFPRISEFIFTGNLVKNCKAIKNVFIS